MPPSAATSKRDISSVVVWAFVFTIPWEKSIQLGGVGTLSRLVGAAAFLAVAGGALRRRSIRPPNLALVLAAAFAAWAGLSWLWSIAPAETAARAVTFAQLFAMLWMIWESCRTARQQLALVRAYVGGAAVASVLTLLRYTLGLQTYYRRYAAWGFDPNDLGLTVALSIPLALYLARRERRPVAWLWRTAALLAIAAILLSASRTALVVGFCGFGFAAWTWRQSDLLQRLSNATLLGLLLAGALYLAPATSRQRLATLPAEATQGTLHNRTQIWRAGWNVLRRHPLLGAGAGAYPEAVRPRLGIPAIPGHRYVAHNSYLSVLVECGVVGLGLFLTLLAVLAAFVWIMPSVERALWSVMLATWAVGITTLTWEQRKPGWLLFGLIMTEWARSFWPAAESP
jgi:O-antigen ligase